MHHDHVRRDAAVNHRRARERVRVERAGRRRHDQLAVEVRRRVKEAARRAHHEDVGALRRRLQVGPVERHHVVRRSVGPERLLLLRRRAREAVLHREVVVVLAHQLGKRARLLRLVVEVVLVVRVESCLYGIIAVGGSRDRGGVCAARDIANIEFPAVRQVVSVRIKLVL